MKIVILYYCGKNHCGSNGCDIIHFLCCVMIVAPHELGI